MSALESPRPGEDPGVRLRQCAADIVEIGARRGQAGELAMIANEGGLTLPAFGCLAAAAAAKQLVLCVRPERWLLVTGASRPGATAGLWQAACTDRGAAIDLSSGLSALHLAGSACREALARGCRLDLDPQMFPSGRAAATVMAQVSVIVAALPSGLLLLTPSTTARHFREWLIATAEPFGLVQRPDLAVDDLFGGSAP